MGLAMQACRGFAACRRKTKCAECWTTPPCRSIHQVMRCLQAVLVDEGGRGMRRGFADHWIAITFASSALRVPPAGVLTRGFLRCIDNQGPRSISSAMCICAMAVVNEKGCRVVSATNRVHEQREAMGRLGLDMSSHAWAFRVLGPITVHWSAPARPRVVVCTAPLMAIPRGVSGIQAGADSEHEINGAEPASALAACLVEAIRRRVITSWICKATKQSCSCCTISQLVEGDGVHS